MKENKSYLLLFVILFGITMAIMYSMDNHSDIELPMHRIDYKTINKVEPFETSSVFEKEAIAEFASEMFEAQGIRSGRIKLEDVGLSKDSLGVSDEIINYTEVTLDDGTIVKFIEPESEVVDMYNMITSDGLIVVIVVDEEGNEQVIKQGDEQFEYYKQALLKEKRSIQTTKLTSLELLLSEASLLGAYDAYLVENKHYNIIRTSKVYFNEKKNYSLMLSKNKKGVEYFFVDAGADLYFDHIYEFSTDFLEVKGFVTSDELEHKMYRLFMEMIENDETRGETTFQGNRLILYRHSD